VFHGEPDGMSHRIVTGTASFDRAAGIRKWELGGDEIFIQI
jgi:hypothetical protein